jgi:hypothetical protein
MTTESSNRTLVDFTSALMTQQQVKEQAQRQITEDQARIKAADEAILQLQREMPDEFRRQLADLAKAPPATKEAKADEAAKK